MLPVLKESLGALSGLQKVYQPAGELVERMESTYIELKDIAQEISDQGEGIEFNPLRLEEVNDRLNLIYSLEQKHRVQTVEELVALSEQYATRLAAITSYDDRIVKLTERRDAQYNKVKKQAAVLTKARTEIAREVEQQMAARLIPLGIPNVRFQVEMGLKKEPGPQGADTVNFLFSANKNDQWSTADGENCTIHTRDGRVYTGVVLNTEPSVHVADSAVETKEENMEILLDENVDTKEGTLSLGVQPGDIIAMDPRTQITPSGYIKSRFLDDKLSASILLGLAKCVKDESIALSRKVSLLFTVYEEVGHGGSFVAEDTTEMISVDMGCVGSDLGCTERMVSICAKDSGGPYNYDVTSALAETAKEEGLDYAIDVYPHYGSDVEATLRAGYDIRHGLVGPGVYASHNYERSHMDGVKNTLLLLKKYIQK